jgi:hypothetical protein
MGPIQKTSFQAVWKTGAIGLAILIACMLFAGSLALSERAEAATTAADSPVLVSTQESINTTAVKDAKKIIKSAKATTGTAKEKLAKIYTYLAQDETQGGVYKYENIPYFFMKFGQPYYSGVQSKIKDELLPKYYKKYAVDMFNEKCGSCFHYAALFAVTAKQALGKDAVVKLAVGPAKYTSTDYHAWVEVKVGKKTYVYDPQAGNLYSKNVESATDFGKFCGKAKSKVKSNYYSYKNVKYTAVKL